MVVITLRSVAVGDRRGKAVERPAACGGVDRDVRPSERRDLRDAKRSRKNAGLVVSVRLFGLIDIEHTRRRA